MSNPNCNWHQDDADDGMWESECGGAFMLNDGTPFGNGMIFCHYCGKPLTQSQGADDEC